MAENKIPRLCGLIMCPNTYLSAQPPRYSCKSGIVRVCRASGMSVGLAKNAVGNIFSEAGIFSVRAPKRLYRSKSRKQRVDSRHQSGASQHHSENGMCELKYRRFVNFCENGFTLFFGGAIL